MIETTEPPDDDARLARLRDWLAATRAEAAALPPPEVEAADTAPAAGLVDLVAEFTALRQEVKLQARSARGLQDQAEALLPALQQAMEQFRAVVPREAQAAWDAGRPLAEALADMDVALGRGLAELDRVQGRNQADDEDRWSSEDDAAQLDALLAAQSPWLRPWLRHYHEQARRIVLGRNLAEPSVADALGPIAEGFGLIHDRLRRAMAAVELWAIECLGEPVDPERMVVVGVADDPEAEPGQVVEEVRRGYTWRGRVLRLAEVIAARPSSG